MSTLGISIQEKNYHPVRDLTLGLMREMFWEVHAKSLIKKGLFDCYYSKQQSFTKTAIKVNESQLI